MARSPESALEDEIADFISALLLEDGESANTCEAYASDLRLFCEFLLARGIRSAAEVSRNHIVAFQHDEREAGRKSSTRARRTVAVRMWLRYLARCRRIQSDPSSLLESPKKEKPLPRTLSEREVAEMIDAVKGTDPRALRDRAMLEVLYGCGLRVSELCALEQRDFASEGELLRILGKGSRERLVPVGSAAGRALSAYSASARDTFARGNLAETHVFLTRLGRPFTRQAVFKIVRERAAAVGIAADRVSPHVLRHCFATHMLAHGADIRVIQELLGHASIGTTQIYTHVDGTRFREVHRRFHPRSGEESV